MEHVDQAVEKKIPTTRELVDALDRCTFTPGSPPKRFVRWAASTPSDYKFSEKALAWLQRLAHAYRRQLGRCMATTCPECTAPPIVWRDSHADLIGQGWEAILLVSGGAMPFRGLLYWNGAFTNRTGSCKSRERAVETIETRARVLERARAQ